MQVVFDEPEPAPAGPGGDRRTRWWPCVAAVLTAAVAVGLLVTRHHSDHADRPVPVATARSSPAPATRAFVSMAATPVALIAYTLPGVVTVYSPDPWHPDPTDADPAQRRFTVEPGAGSPTVTLAVVDPVAHGTIWDVTQQRVAELAAARDSVVQTVFSARDDGRLAGDVTWNDADRHTVERTLLDRGRAIRVSVTGPLAAANDVDALFTALSAYGIVL